MSINLEELHLEWNEEQKKDELVIIVSNDGYKLTRSLFLERGEYHRILALIQETRDHFEEMVGGLDGQLDIILKPCSDNSNLMSIVFHFRYNQMLYGSIVNIPCSELSELETIIKREIENFNRIISWSNEDEE